MTIKKIQQKQHSLTEKLLCAVIKGGGGVICGDPGIEI